VFIPASVEDYGDDTSVVELTLFTEGKTQIWLIRLMMVLFDLGLAVHQYRHN